MWFSNQKRKREDTDNKGENTQSNIENDNIMKENKQDTKNNIQVIREAIYNVQSRKELFQKSFEDSKRCSVLICSLYKTSYEPSSCSS